MLEQALHELEIDEQMINEVSEEGAKEILMTLVKQKIHKPGNMSYRQVQQQKRDVRNSRGYRPVGGAGGAGQTMRRDLQHLKSVTKCKACGEVGHWHRECPNKSKMQSMSSTSTGQSNSASTNHSWWSIVQSEEMHPDSMNNSVHDSAE